MSTTGSGRYEANRHVYMKDVYVWTLQDAIFVPENPN